MDKIVIVGGGYAGVLTAKKLLKNLSKQIKTGDVQITLIDKLPYHTLLTQLHEVAFERTNKENIKLYYTKIFNTKKINIVMDEITDINFDSKVIQGKTNSYDYTYLIKATGAAPNFFGVSGAKEYALPVWNLKDTVKINQLVLANFAKAELESDPKIRKQLLTFVVAGAGFTGVEVVGELEEWIRYSLIKKYPLIALDEVTIHLIDGGTRILKSFDQKASRKAHQRLIKNDINVILNSFITKVTPDAIYFGSNQFINTNMVIWTSGITCNPICPQKFSLENGNRIPVDDNLEMTDYRNAYVLGDIMHYIPKGQVMSVPQMVENCEQAAPIIAHNISCKIKSSDKKLKQYNPTFHGAMASIGGRYCVAEIKVASFKFVCYGFLAMFIKHFINAAYVVTAAGFRQVWAYIKAEVFNVKDNRSFVGGHFSTKSPSIYLVPLRFWLGMYWFRQGYPKLVHSFSQGWKTVCVDTEIFPENVKDYGAFCQRVYPQGELEFYKKFPDSVNVPTQLAAEVDLYTKSQNALINPVAVDAVTSPTNVITSPTSTQVVDPNPLISTANYINDIAPKSTDFGLGYNLEILPDWLVDFLVNFTNGQLELIASFEWLMQLVFNLLETLFGLFMMLGLFMSFTSIGLFILSIVISIGSLASYGMIVEGLFWSMFGAFSMITVGTSAPQPLSIDYYLSGFKKNRKVKRKNKTGAQSDVKNI